MMSSETREGESYDAWRTRLAAMHDDGAEAALLDVLGHDNVPVECGSYCYGGSAAPDYTEILADLAEAGWRLTREGVPSDG
jgi:hypothetical protein